MVSLMKLSGRRTISSTINITLHKKCALKQAKYSRFHSFSLVGLKHTYHAAIGFACRGHLSSGLCLTVIAIDAGEFFNIILKVQHEGVEACTFRAFCARNKSFFGFVRHYVSCLLALLKSTNGVKMLPVSNCATIS